MLAGKQSQRGQARFGEVDIWTKAVARVPQLAVLWDMEGVKAAAHRAAVMEKAENVGKVASKHDLEPDVPANHGGHGANVTSSRTRNPRPSRGPTKWTPL